jgi:transcriptional regulator with XRE-family HTH domain
MNNIKNKELIIAFGNRVRDLRKKKKLSMEALAADAGIEYKQLANVELGKINTTISTAQAIAGALEIPLNKLFDFDISQNKAIKKG